MFRRAIGTNRSEDWGKYHKVGPEGEENGESEQKGKLQKIHTRAGYEVTRGICKKDESPSTSSKKGRKSENVPEKGARSTLQSMTGSCTTSTNRRVQR